MAFACLRREAEYRARQLIVTAGAWISAFFPDLPLRIERQVLFWFDQAGASESFAPDHCPVHLWQFDGRRFFYGFPNFGNGVKVAFHHGGETTTVDSVRAQCRARGSGRHPRSAEAFASGGGRNSARDHRLHVHQHAGRTFLDRQSSCASEGVDRKCVLWARIQIFSGHRRNPRRFSGVQAPAVRPQSVLSALKSEL